MKYFAKYIVVPGKIVPPCIVLETLTTGKTELFQVDGPEDIDTSTQKLVKLFLCSRDIQVGDKVICDGEEDIVEQYPFEDPQPLPDGGYTIVLKEKGTQMADNCYKVIGEISPEAGWVREGDEFEEKDIMTSLIDDWKYQVHIKGPCGHYH